MLKLLIVDAAEEFCTAMTEVMGADYVIQTCSNGNAALETIVSFAPDVLVLDLTVPGMDGLSIAERLRAEHRSPVILATTRFLSDYVLHAAGRIGIDYMMVKPCSPRAVGARLEDLVRNRESPLPLRRDLRMAAAELLLALGISAGSKGYQYLREAIPRYVRDPQQMLTKELYPAIAKAYGASLPQVERAMRTAIERAWKNRDEQLWLRYFPNRGGNPEKPSNWTFISRLAALLETEAWAE